MNNKKVIQTKQAPQAIGAYSQAIESNGLVFISGQIPLTAEGALNTETFSDQAHQVIANLKAICQQAGGTLDDIVKLSVLLTDLANFAEINLIMQQHFTQPFPARAAYQVSALPKGVDIEIEAIMAKT